MTFTNEGNLLADVSTQYIRASTGKRIANYLIDIVAFYIVIFILFVIWGFIDADAVSAFLDDNDSGIGMRIVGILLYALFMGLQETIFKGRSIGKFITNTKAIRDDGSPISASVAFARGFSRAVPFVIFSAFGNPCSPWQDRWTNTIVADLKKSVYH
jgi:uncharacterized RDD family membrane protein YckC